MKLDRIKILLIFLVIVSSLSAQSIRINSVRLISGDISRNDKVNFEFESVISGPLKKGHWKPFIEYSYDGGLTYSGSCSTIEGDTVIYKIGQRHNVSWYPMKDLSNFKGDNIVFRIKLIPMSILKKDDLKISSLVFPTLIRRNNRYKSTNIVYGGLVLGALFKGYSYYNYDLYLKETDSKSLISNYYNQANLFNKLSIITVGSSAFVFTINLNRFIFVGDKHKKLRHSYYGI